jgi:hypothetical protein
MFFLSITPQAVQVSQPLQISSIIRIFLSRWQCHLAVLSVTLVCTACARNGVSAHPADDVSAPRQYLSGQESEDLFVCALLPH